MGIFRMTKTTRFIVDKLIVCFNLFVLQNRSLNRIQHKVCKEVKKKKKRIHKTHSETSLASHIE